MLLWVAVILGTVAGIYYIFLRFRKIRDGSTSRPRQPNNGTNPDEDLSSEAEDAWRRKDYERLLLLLEKDSPFPVGFSIEEVVAEQSIREQLKRFVEGRERLHEWISKGDFKSIIDYTNHHKPSVYYSTDNVSALTLALQCGNKDISSHFSEIMPKFSILEMAEKNLLYSGIMEKPHLRKLVSVTRFSEEYSKEEFEAIITMYQILEKQRKISCLFNAVQNGDFEIIFAMKTEILKTDVGGRTREANGYTELNGQIFIAGKGINTEEGKQKVYRVFAHEFCHLAMQIMYKNNFKPYLPHDEKRISFFSVMCEEIHKKHEDMHEIFKKVYEVYDKIHWHHELIVRIPEMMALFGEENAFHRFREQISELYKYYEEHIVKDCNEFSDRKFYSEELKKLKNISNDHLVVPNADICFPLFAKTENYEKYLVPWEARGYKFSFLPTSNPELGALQILHELKKLHADRRYLAFKLEHYYYKNGYNGKIIDDAFDSPAFEKLILVMPDTMLNCEPKRIYDDIFYGSTKEKEVIVVVSSDLCDKYPEWKVKEKLQFNWNDLSEGFKNKLLEKPVLHQGIRTSLKVVFESVELTTDILKNVLSDKEMCIGEALSSFGDEKDMYIERTFVRFVYNFQGEQMPSPYLFMTGVSEMTVNLKKWSQTLSKYDDEIEKGKYIFVTKDEKNSSNFFKNFCSNIKKESKQVFWIHHTNGKYLLREPLGGSEDIENHFVEETLDENQMLKETDGMTEVLVADDPGAGKSTSITSLMGKMKREYPEKLIFRVNFSEHLKEFSASRSLHSLLEVLQRVFKMNTPLEKMTLQAIIGVPGRVVVFFDGFDEMSKKIQINAMETLQLLGKETKIQMWIFTRRHERLTLEEEMNTVSFSLRQLSLDDQCKYFNQFWKSQLISLKQEKEDSDNKFQKILNNLKNSSGKCEGRLESMKKLVNLLENENQEEFKKKINELDFSDYSILVINSIKDSILKGKFMVPLWLWMMANIIIDSNFKIPNQTNRFTFYSNFLDEKVNSYLRDECGIQCQSKKQQRIYDRERAFIFENLWTFFDRQMRSELHDDDLEKDDLKTDGLKEKDLEELVDVGLLRKEGDDYHFFHMTFVEFFISQMIVKEIESENLRSVQAKFLSDVLLKESYREVRIFLDDFLEKDESPSFIFPKSLLQGFDMFKTYSEFCKRINDRTGDWICKRIFQSCEMYMKESVDEHSILNVLNISPFNRSLNSLDGVMDLINSTFTDRMLFIMFDSRLDVSHEFLFRCLYDINSNDLNAIMSIFQNIINYKKSHLRSEEPYTSNSLGNVKVGLNIFEKKCKDKDGNSVLHFMTAGRKGKVLECLIEIQSIIGNEKLNKLLTMQNGDGETMLHILMEYSEDPKDVISVLEFLKGVMEEKLFKQFLIKKDNKGIFPISCANLHIMKDILVFMGSYFSKEYIIIMLWENNVHLKEHLEKSIRDTKCALEEILYLEDFLGSELLNDYGDSVLHLMTKGRKGKVLEYLREIQSIIGNEKLNKLLTMKNFKGETMLHILMFYSEDPKEAIAVLEFVEGVMEEKLFKQFLIKKDDHGRFPISCANLHIMKDVLVFMRRHFSNEYVIDMLKINKVHRITDCALEEILYLEEILGSKLFREILISKDEDGETRLHWLMRDSERADKLFVRDLKVYNRLLDRDSMRDFLFSQNKYGNTFLHYWANRGSQYFDIFRELHSIFSPDAFEELLNIRNDIGETFIRYFKGPISELYSYLVEFLGKKKFIKLVTNKDYDGETRLHWIKYYFDVLIKDLKFFSELLDESSFRDFIFTKNKYGKTFCYKYKLSKLNKLEGILSPDLLLELQKTV